MESFRAFKRVYRAGKLASITGFQELQLMFAYLFFGDTALSTSGSDDDLGFDG